MTEILHFVQDDSYARSWYRSTFLFKMSIVYL